MGSGGTLMAERIADSAPHDPYGALRIPNFRDYLAGSFLDSSLYEAISPSVGADWLGLAIGAAISIIGISIAYYCYVRNPGVTLRMAAGMQVTLERNAIKSMKTAGLSMMPEGLEEGTKAQDLADVMEFIMSAK